MIMFYAKPFIARHRCGVIQNCSFWCALITSRMRADVWTSPGEPVAKALLDKALTPKQVRAIHDSFLEELDQCGTDGLDLSGAIEQVFGRARNKNIVIRYQNNARPLLEQLARFERAENYERTANARTDG
jgi:hypothetical protein